MNLVEREISEKTKAIIPVHLYGQPVKNFDKLVQIANKYSLYIIEDCAQAVFAKYKDSYVGTIGDIISFYPEKNLGAYGDAGVVISNNDELSKGKNACKPWTKKKHTHIYEGLIQEWMVYKAI